MNNEKMPSPNSLKRRGFFGRALAGSVGLFSLGGIVQLFSRTTETSDAKQSVTVRINPHAVPRTSTDSNIHG